MNLGWYEIMDRISVIQGTLEDSVREHPEMNNYSRHLIDQAQEILCDTYQYAGQQFNDSCDGDENV